MNVWPISLLLVGVSLWGCATSGPMPAAESPAQADNTKTTGAGLGPTQIMADEPFRATRPEPLTSRKSFEGPVPTVTQLRNGATVMVHENRKLPLVAIEVVLRTGTNGEPAGKSGLAALTAAAAAEATRSRIATQLATELEDLAAQLTTLADRESTRIHLNCLKETLPRAVGLLADVVQNPAFRPADVDRARGIAVTAAIQRRGSPDMVARDELDRLLFGHTSPWGKPQGGTPEDVRALTVRDLTSFHNQWYRPNNATVVVSGDVSPDEAKALLQRHFGSWKRATLPRLSSPQVVAKQPRSVMLIERSGLTQSQVVVGGKAVAAKHPDALKVMLANYILGGLFSARLNQNIRQDKGYSYGVFSRAQLLRDTGTLFAFGGMISKHTVEAVAELEKEVVRFSNGDISEKEVELAKLALHSNLPTLLETNDAIAEALGNLRVLDLPLDYYRTLADRVKAITPDEIRAAAKQYYQSADWPIVIVGPPEDFRNRLEGLKLGAVERKSLEAVTDVRD